MIVDPFEELPVVLVGPDGPGPGPVLSGTASAGLSAALSAGPWPVGA
ncbi:hypothetical protein [Streptosporangium roseum]|nr:hypothetical protein [Streptosporangium roseum]